MLFLITAQNTHTVYTSLIECDTAINLMKKLLKIVQTHVNQEHPEPVIREIQRWVYYLHYQSMVKDMTL